MVNCRRHNDENYVPSGEGEDDSEDDLDKKPKALARLPKKVKTELKLPQAAPRRRS
jgi:hypothetical protein